jgi:hypothetical protein
MRSWEETSTQVLTLVLDIAPTVFSQQALLDNECSLGYELVDY